MFLVSHVSVELMKNKWSRGIHVEKREKRTYKKKKKKKKKNM